ncbi:vWA domain-containing protein [Vibrio natriegens]|uniref:IMP dehydrogenase n=1 Tax=Vibrio natriegens NBRC 15636 = ATCC 14048 = DSM 759 TaxID=1219067 RepID=A0AAN0Y6T4_VIBNA|nr:VWA domain-containing protein [Vibrio natriegens]ALR17341.1 IMP dehydrogenase [Vibrio natriegens NBRC 15636 = ATCC 14048 = DSM 759]ANQ14831.1 IMP dehydrogenase [Vibrio natriegens NBRC 15636 = ATCC 14048 = DSM 759]EPM39885.1 aerotolerance operon protein BatA [Vibrio natriegens NBRC 15636 = ATCC 14048 = DSM 759]MDX6029848.1 VWA domain-containing protein [Vibrio natriegens NBRC 15636 = ATCC 14048 = DSM 759]UUI13470.1 VWA domain-containing protein [Vibrio natriegens]
MTEQTLATGLSQWLNIEFVWWWALILLPLPLLVYKLLPRESQQAEIKLAYLPDNTHSNKPKQKLQKTLSIAIWTLLIIACARPVWFGDPIEFQPKYRDLMLVVDLSGSMQKEDMNLDGEFTDRLTAVKKVLSDFVAKRKGDRLGVVLFGDHAYLQTPLTADRQAVIQQINQTVIGLVGQSTAMGDGIGLGTKTFVDSNAPQRVMVLLSDGGNTAGVLDPIEAAEIAKKYNATIYTVGVGAGEMMVKEFFMTRKVDTAADLDEKTLTQIAEVTGGQYFRARDAEQLENIYETINQLEPVSNDTQTWRPQSEWFRYPLSAALGVSVLLFFLRRKHV